MSVAAGADCGAAVDSAVVAILSGLGTIDF